MHRQKMLLAAFFGLSVSNSACAAPAPAPANETVRIIHPQKPRNWRGAALEGLQVTIWHPADNTASALGWGGSSRAQTTWSRADAAEGQPSFHRRRYPLILLSHGTGGSADGLAWMARALARGGYIVAAVDHPGNNYHAPATWEGFNLWWERAADLSDVLDGILTDPEYGTQVDRDRIGAAGFSLGGYTVLSLAGARTDLAAFKTFCGGPDADAVCQRPPEAARLDNPPSDNELSPTTKASFARSGDSYRDPRIRSVLAMAPAVGRAFTARGLTEVSVPVALITGTDDTIVPPRTNAEHIANLLHAPLIRIPGASHYSFLPICSPAPAQRSPMPRHCEEGPGVDRAALHQTIIAAARNFFDRTLAAKQ